MKKDIKSISFVMMAFSEKKQTLFGNPYSPKDRKKVYFTQYQSINKSM